MQLSYSLCAGLLIVSCSLASSGLSPRKSNQLLDSCGNLRDGAEDTTLEFPESFYTGLDENGEPLPDTYDEAFPDFTPEQLERLGELALEEKPSTSMNAKDPFADEVFWSSNAEEGDVKEEMSGSMEYDQRLAESFYTGFDSEGYPVPEDSSDHAPIHYDPNLGQLEKSTEESMLEVPGLKVERSKISPRATMITIDPKALKGSNIPVGKLLTKINSVRLEKMSEEEGAKAKERSNKHRG